MSVINMNDLIFFLFQSIYKFSLSLSLTLHLFILHFYVNDCIDCATGKYWSYIDQQIQFIQMESHDEKSSELILFIVFVFFYFVQYGKFDEFVRVKMNITHS